MQASINLIDYAIRATLDPLPRTVALTRIGSKDSLPDFRQRRDVCPTHHPVTVPQNGHACDIHPSRAMGTAEKICAGTGTAAVMYQSINNLSGLKIFRSDSNAMCMRTFFTTAVPSSKATWVSAPKSSGAEFNTAQEFDPQCDREPRWRSAAVRWFSESQRCTPSVPATPTGSTRVRRLKPTPTAHQQTSDVHISQHTLAARRSCDAIRPPARMENPPLCPQPCITATIFLLTKPCGKNSRDARCRTATSKHSTQAAFTCATRNASPCRPGAITISSMHKCKCMYAFNFPPFTIVW